MKKNDEYFLSIHSDYLLGFSTTDLSKKYGVPISSMRRDLMQTGIVMRTRKESLQIDRAKKKISKAHIGRNRKFSKEHKNKISKSRITKTDFTGYRISSNGYIELTRGKFCGKMLHKIIAEALIGRSLLDGEVVHHKDFNKLNNDPENLCVMNKNDHNSLHAKILTEGRERNNLGQYK